jgi:hypothetical protein
MKSLIVKIIVLLEKERQIGKFISKDKPLSVQKANSMKMLTAVFALASILISGCVLRRPEPGSITDEIGEICFFQDLGQPWHAQVKTEGCYSTRCTRQVQKVGNLILDRDNHTMSFEASWVLEETSGFSFGCTDDCMGGGTVDFYIDDLDVGDWTVSFGDEEIGNVLIPSGRLIERQCLSS